MKGFAAGVGLGAVLGIAATAAFVGRRERDDVETRPQPATDPSPRVVSTPRTRRAAPAPEVAIAPPVETASPTPAPANAAAALDFEAAPLDELLAAIERFVADSNSVPAGTANLSLDAIARRFPDYRYTADFVHRIAAKHSGAYGNVLSRAISTWSDDAAVAELRRCFGLPDAADHQAGRAIGEALGRRDVRLPTDLVRSLLDDERPDVRDCGINLVYWAAEIDVARLKQMAADDRDPATRCAMLYEFQSLVPDRLRPDDVADTIVAAVRDPNPDVREAAESALVAAGPKGAQAALDILARDGEVNAAQSLVWAVVANGRTGDVLDLHLGGRVARHVVDALVSLSPESPELLRDAAPRLKELRAAAAATDSATDFFGAVGRTLGTRFVVESALARELDPGTRDAAVNALLGEPDHWLEGHALVRRIAADRAENARMRLDAIENLESGAPDGRDDEIHAETRKFLTDLLRDETNDRVRAAIEQRLKND